MTRKDTKFTADEIRTMYRSDEPEHMDFGYDHCADLLKTQHGMTDAQADDWLHTYESKSAAITALSKLSHTFISVEGVGRIVAPFELDVGKFVREYRAAHKSDPKGLQFDDGAKSKMGAAAWDLARDMCNAYNLKAVPALGRGTQHRNYCAALAKHFAGQ